MSTSPVFASDEKELDYLLEHHPGEKSNFFDLYIGPIVNEYRQDSCINKSSIDIYDLTSNQIIFHKSCYEKYLKQPTVNVHILDNRKQIDIVTHKEDLLFWHNTLLNTYKMITTLPMEKLKTFAVIGSRRILETNTDYGYYIHEITPVIIPGVNVIHFIRIKTKRTGVVEIPQFRIIRNTPSTYYETHLYSRYLQQCKLTTRQTELLEYFCNGEQEEDIARKMKIKIHSVRKYIRRINIIMHVDHISIAVEIWCILWQEQHNNF